MKNQKRNIFEESTEIIGWIEIFLSPFIASCILGGIIYLYFGSLLSLISSILIIIIGVLAGIKFAGKIYNSKEGTIHFVSRVSASPELDKEENKIKNDSR